MKKFLLWFVGIIALIVVAVAAVWNGEIRTLASIEQVGDDPYLYTCNYQAPYDLDAVLDAGIDANAKLVSFVIGRLSRGLYKPEPKVQDATSPVTGQDATSFATGIGAKRAGRESGRDFACTTFQAGNAGTEGGSLFGRNYDYFKNPSLVLWASPKDGYASISTCDLSHLGYGLEKLPTKLASKALCLAAVYAPMDGMNEKGLCVSIMALPKQAAWQDTGKPVVGTSVYMRLLLDRCATVEEALELTRSLDIRHDQQAGGGYHYLIADAQGHCAAVEFDLRDGWKTLVTEKPDSVSYMHMTNHLLAPKYYTTEPDPELGNPHSRSWWRYAEVKSYMDARDGIVTPDQAQECLAAVHWKDLVWENGMVEDTQWSNVYDQSALTLRLRDWYDYDTTHNFSLK